jgi:signal transduction histidine kinase
VSTKWRAILVGCVLIALSPTFFLAPATTPATVARAVAVGLALVQAVAIWWMPVRPGLVTAVVLVAGAITSVFYPAIGPGVSLVVLSTFAWLREARLSLRGLAGAVVAYGAVSLATGHWTGVALWFAAALLAWSWGALGRAWDARRRAEAQRAVLEERARIGRELHDVLAHTVSVMVIQAAAADDIFELDPAKARAAVRQVEESGRQALAELRGFIRTAGEQPSPRLSDLARLAGSLSSTGLQVSVRHEGERTLGPAVEASVYRIVQESLTNTLRHAHAAHADVLVRIGTEHVEVEVTDDGHDDGHGSGSAHGRGRGPGRLTGAGAGQGIIGMRERARLLGGTLEAGPRADGGFRVYSRLPVDGPGANG